MIIGVISVLIASRVCKESNKKLNQLFMEDNLLHSKDITVEKVMEQALKTLKEKDKLLFLKCYKDHYIAGKYLLEESGLRNSVLKDFKFLQPNEIKNKRSTDRIRNISHNFQIHGIMPIDVIDEFRLLQIKMCKEMMSIGETL